MGTHRKTDTQKRQKLYIPLAYFVCQGYNKLEGFIITAKKWTRVGEETD